MKELNLIELEKHHLDSQAMNALVLTKVKEGRLPMPMAMQTWLVDFGLRILSKADLIGYN